MTQVRIVRERGFALVRKPPQDRTWYARVLLAILFVTALQHPHAWGEIIALSVGPLRRPAGYQCDIPSWGERI